MARNNPRNTQVGAHTFAPAQMLKPGDEAAPGTPGTGEDICPHCHGSGRMAASFCPNCAGTGTIVKAIGGA